MESLLPRTGIVRHVSVQGQPSPAPMALTHLQLLDRFPSFADDQPHFRRGDKELLDRAVAVYIVVKARSIPTSVHNLPQEPFGLSLGGRKITRDPALNGRLRRSGKGGTRETKEPRQPSIQLQLLPHNLGGLNHSPRYRTASRSNTRHSTALAPTRRLRSRPQQSHRLMPALCTCLHRHSASLPPACSVSSCFVLCPPLSSHPGQPSQETLSTLVSKGGGEKER